MDSDAPLASTATGSVEPPPPPPSPPSARSRRITAIVIVAVALVVLLAGGGLIWRAEARVNHTTLAARPRPVSVVTATRASYRDSRTYIGTIEPWIEASIGPQYTSAYVLTVAVRPGDVVKRGAVVATLDCSNPRQTSRAAQMQAQAIDSHQRAIADESHRIDQLVHGGFAAVNESEQKQAETRTASAELDEANAKLASAQLGVADCALLAPFDGDIATRVVDPGAFVRPGETIVSVVDRHVDRITGDAPEKDFDVVGVGTAVSVAVLATGGTLTANVSRRAPKADPGTRTVHFEIDVPDPQRAIPVGTTGTIHIDVGKPVPTTQIPVYAAAVTEAKATVFIADHGVAHKRELKVIGDAAGGLYFAPDQLPEGTQVVSEGRALLSDGDRIDARPEVAAPPAAGSGSGSDADEPEPPRGGGHGSPL